MKRFLIALGLLVLFATSQQSAYAQNRTRFAGRYNALDYAFGIQGAGPAQLQVYMGAASGTQTLVLNTGWTALGDGTIIYPLNTNSPIIVDVGANQETVTPTAVATACGYQSAYGSCTITATFAYAHGNGAPITSGSLGLQEAVNAANGSGGGAVDVSGSWSLAGGTTAMITSAIPYSSVYIEDLRGKFNTYVSNYWVMTPTTLTTISAPTTLTSTTLTAVASPVGTWAASSYSFCITYVDALGGESACSGNYTATPTVNYSIVYASPAASTGAVGWRAYAGTTNSAGAYLLPITSSTCTLTTLESVMPACAIGSSATFSAVYVNTAPSAPLALGVTNTVNPVPQSHTTFSYQPCGSSPAPFQTNYGPFGSGTISSATASDLTPLGTFELPPGYMNQIGRTVRVSGKISLTAGASSTLGIVIGTAWNGMTAGAPVTVCNPISGFVFATHAYDVNFTCTMTTNAVGATAIGTVMPMSNFLASYSTGTLTPVATDAAVAAVGSLPLFAQQQFTVELAPLVAADTTVQLVGLSIETLE